MVRALKIFVCGIALIAAFCGTVQAATHTVYEEGNLSTTYVTYFKDIISGAEFNDNYVAFRSGQYSYTMVVGELEYSNGVISLVDTGKEYVFTTSSGYNATYKYNVNEISNFSLDSGENIIYSDVGDYPQLVERGAKFEIFTAILICICMLSFVIRNIFYKR